MLLVLDAAVCLDLASSKAAEDNLKLFLIFFFNMNSH